MTDILLVGALGRMGHAVAQCVAETPDAQIVAGVDVADNAEGMPFPVYPALSDVKEHADIVIDFSRPASLEGVLEYCMREGAGAVLATTGYSQGQQESIRKASAKVPIFQTPNFSIGVALVRELTQIAAGVLAGRYDVEIVERHHNKKVDAPSGTALALAESVRAGTNEPLEFVYGRAGKNVPRQENEIGIHAVRGGTIVGEHEVMFLGPQEEVNLVHKAYSREIFAQGAVRAAQFLKDQQPGMYDMRNLLRSLGMTKLPAQDA